jgi:predicted aminopeptidase
VRNLIALAGALCVSGCFSVRYVVQAGAGQYELLHLARPLSQVIDDHQVPAHTRELLSRVAPIKRFGQLNGLTPTSNYTQFSDLHRSAAVYVVQGCAPLSFQIKRWVFPIVGTVPYLGFFDEARARDYAKALEAEEHLDVTVRTAAAYSTLGWFRDPVLSTMLAEGPEAFGDLANTILHESVHATIYLPNQSTFDESLASFIADHLTWTLVVGAYGLDSPIARGWLDHQRRVARFSVELRRAHDDLAAIYDAADTDEVKLRRKRERLELLRLTLGLKRPYNNADLAGVRTYAGGTEAFERLRLACGGLPRMLGALKTLSAADFETPQQLEFDPVIDRLRQRACPSDQASRSASRTPGS